MSDQEEDPTLKQVDFMDQSLPYKIKEEPTQHVSMYYTEKFSTSCGIKRKSDFNLEDEIPSKKLCEYITSYIINNEHNYRN